jgi:hypothetical protein
MSFADQFAPAIEAIFDRLGVATTYTFAPAQPVECRVVFDRSILTAEGYPAVIEGQATLAFLRSEIAAPRAKARVPIAADTWQLESKTVSDQFHERWTCRRVLT